MGSLLFFQLFQLTLSLLVLTQGNALSRVGVCIWQNKGQNTKRKTKEKRGFVL